MWCTGWGVGAGKGQDRKRIKNSSSYLIERTVWGQRWNLTTDMNEKF